MTARSRIVLTLVLTWLLGALALRLASGEHDRCEIRACERGTAAIVDGSCWCPDGRMAR